ncbi:MAG: hypothetical protein K6C97_12300 [Treponema sp.]|nr:hypothetical protein [Treponema sp.]
MDWMVYMLSDKEFEHIIKMITQHTGIIPKNSHQESIRHYLEDQYKDQFEVPGFRLDSYINDNPQEIESLINAVTVNETYFFREEGQFKLLQEKIFPELRIIFPDSVNIWSAACSSGEEIYSLALLGQSAFLPAKYTASDINTSMLEKCKKGLYGKNSVRRVDGSHYHYLLPRTDEEGRISMPEDLKAKINIQNINLSQLTNELNICLLPKNQHLIFIRNVFIYFSMEMRSKILKAIVDNSMAEGAYLFVSTNEIASLEPSILPANLKKCSDGNVFYFKKEAKHE